MGGQWPTPQAQAYWQAMQAGRTPYPFYRGAPTTTPGAAPFVPGMAPEQELDFLKNQAQAIREQLELIETRIRNLKAKEK